MITGKKTLKEYLKHEKKIYRITFSNEVLALLGCSEKGMIWRYQKRLRKYEYHINCRHKIRAAIYHFKTTKLGYKLGFSLHPNCCEKGLHLTHIGTVSMNTHTKIGKNCVIHANTHFIATNGIDIGPTIGDNCMVGVGAILIGQIEIGNNTTIGAGSVVTKSFKEGNCTIAGVPAKIIK